MRKVDKAVFFETESNWKKHWKDMPEYIHEDLIPYQTINIHFENSDNVKKFSELLNQKITNKTKSIWYPKLERNKIASKIIKSDNSNNPKYSIYIISKGRWGSRLTVKALEKINVDYYIVVEPQEYDNYASVIDSKKILTLPFSNLGQGSIPARNWVWEHSIKTGAERHWILDDNINGFIYQNNNKRTPLNNALGFITIENFCDRYSNIALAGMHYRFFAPPNIKNLPPFYLNTRIYSCILIKNNINYRWRGRYNEDTDLSLRVLKDNWCTILFNIFKINKKATMIMKGGNTDELYKGDGRLKMAQSLRKQHPDVVKITKKWGRYQHQVNYSRFKRNKLILKSECKSDKSFFDTVLDNLYTKLDKNEQ